MEATIERFCYVDTIPVNKLAQGSGVVGISEQRTYIGIS